ncbi:hypothetical protein ACGC1H_007084 [Rhizoctonia solani]
MKHLEASVPLPTQPPRKTLWLVLAATCAFLTATCQFHSPRPRVRIAETTHVGYYDRAHRQTKYLGIPYAQPPLGHLRFHPPRAHNNNLSHTIIADTFGPACPQSTPVPYPVSESCLTLNIWIPDVPAPVKRSLWSEIQNGLPVLVWIYGGGFINGSTLKYPADGLVEAAMDLGKPVIVASMNYRLGMFGFPVGAEPAASGAHNLGLLDQRLALEWIHSHITHFGGDPKKITLFGESAGSMSVGAQMAYRGGNTGGIFRAAIMQSGAPSTYVPTRFLRHPILASRPRLAWPLRFCPLGPDKRRMTALHSTWGVLYQVEWAPRTLCARALNVFVVPIRWTSNAQNGTLSKYRKVSDQLIRSRLHSDPASTPTIHSSLTARTALRKITSLGMYR